MQDNEKKPALRFKGFTDPWEQRKLGELVEIGDIDHRMPETVDVGIPYLMTGDFCGTNELNFNGVKLISEIEYNQLSQKIKPEQGDILFARYASVGTVRYVDFTRKFLISYSCAIIKKGKKINSQYLYHFITSDEAQKQIKLQINTGSQSNIGIDSMKNNILVQMPLIDEQVQIANMLTNLDHLITLHQRKYEKLVNIKKSMLDKMFPKNGASVPEIRFKGFTDPWEQRKLKELYFQLTERNADLLPYQKTLSVATMSFKTDGNGAADTSLANYKRLRTGDIAFEGHTSKEFRYGRFVLNDVGDGIMSPRFSALRPLHEMPINFWKYYIHYEPIMRKVLVNSTKAGTMMNELVINEFLQGSILVPSMAEQQAIGRFFKQLDTLITLHQRKLEKLQNIKKSCLEKMFV